MIKLIVLVRKRPDLTQEEFLRYWHEKHGPLAAKLFPDARRYIQNHVRPEASHGADLCDGIAELWFDDLATLQAALSSPSLQEGLADGQNFADPERVTFLVADEVPIIA